MPVREKSLFYNASEKHKREFGIITLIEFLVSSSFKLDSNVIVKAFRKNNKSNHSWNDSTETTPLILPMFTQYSSSNVNLSFHMNRD